MRSSMCCALLFAVLQPGIASAQALPSPSEMTVEQRWERAASILDQWLILSLRQAKARGMTSDEWGQEIGALFAVSWGRPGERTPVQFVEGMWRNSLLYPKAEFESLYQCDDSVVVRFNRPWTALLGETGVLGTVSKSELDRGYWASLGVIADYLGLSMSVRPEGEDVLVRVGWKDPNRRSEYRYWPVGEPGRDATPMTGTWEGEYTCRGVLRAATLELKGDAHGVLQGTMSIRRHPDGPEFGAGTYGVSGALTREGTFALVAGDWMGEPTSPTLVKQAVRGTLSADGRSLAGELINYSCGAFTARKR